MMPCASFTFRWAQGFTLSYLACLPRLQFGTLHHCHASLLFAHLVMAAIPQVRHLPLVKVDDAANGNTLRQFLARYASCRSRCRLPPDEPLTWKSMGIDLDDSYRLESDSLQDILLRAHYVMALPESEFCKTSPKFTLRSEVLAAKKASKADVLSWSARG